MKVAFRVDTSLQIGTGHIMRCLTLAQVLKDNGADVGFICRKHEGNLIDKIRSSGFIVHELEVFKETKVDTRLAHSHWLGATQQQDADDCIDILKAENPDWLIVDHYALDEKWHKILKPFVKKIMVIDDLADKNIDCDVLLNQNLGSKKEDYKNKVPNDCRLLLDCEYVLLRPEFGIKRVIAFSSKTSDLLKTIKVYDDKLAYHTRKIDENNKTFYPKQGGVGFWIDKLLEQLVQNGVKILTEETIVDIKHHDSKISGITLKSGKKIQCDHLVWTLPAVFLNNIVNKNIESGKNTVKPMFVTNSLYHFVIDKPYLTKSYFLYFYEPSFRSFRATFYNNFRVEKTDKYLVTVEVISNPSFKDIPDKQDIFNELKESKSIPDDANFIECSINELAAGFPLPTKDLAQNNTMMYEKIIESFHNISMLGKSSNSGFFMQDVMVSSFNEIQKVSDKFK